MPRLLVHIQASPITDLLLKLISLEDFPETQGIVDWFCDREIDPIADRDFESFV